MVRVGINGLGTMGRGFIRAVSEQIEGRKLKEGDIEVVAINDLFPAEQLAPLLAHDTNYGRFQGTVEAEEGKILVNDKPILCYSLKNTAELPWGNFGIDVVYESTGAFNDNQGALEGHLKAGANNVVISAPSKLNVPTIVMGVNDEEYKSESIVSNASCTTNCLAPLAQAISNEFGPYRGLMTTIHAYTADQRLVDAPHKDIARAYAAAENMLPTTTGAAKAIGRVISDLDEKLDGVAVRVPLPVVSLVDLTAILDNLRSITVEGLNAGIKRQADNDLCGVLDYREGPLVSSMIRGEPIPSVFDASQTKTVGNLVKVFSWYDNVSGYSHQAVNLVRMIAGEKS